MQAKFSRVPARLLCTAAAIAIGTNPAFAEDAANEDDGNIITVIGVTKQAAKIQDTPAAITVFDEAQLQSQGVREVKELGKFTPGFIIREAGNNPTAFALAIRGQVQNDNIATLEPSVGVYLDDLYIARAYGMNTNLLDIKSAQVLKGPQGTLFGRNTSAGAVILQTNDPLFGQTSGRASLTYGRFDEVGVTSVLNVGSDTFAVRGAMFYGTRGDYQLDVNTKKGLGSYRNVNGRLKVAIKPVEDLTIIASGEWFDSNIDGSARQNQYYNLGGSGFDPAAADRALFQGNPDRVALTQPSQTAGIPAQGVYNNTKTETYMLKAILNTSFGEVKWINGYRKVKGDNLIDLDGSSATNGNHMSTATQDLSQWSSELQLTGSAMADRLSYALGVTYLTESGTDTSRTTTLGGTNWTGFSGDIDNKSVGIYGQLNYKATDRLGITAGLRWSHDRKGVTVQSAVFPNNGSTPAVCLPVTFTGVGCNRSRSDSWNNLSYTVGLDYKVTDDVLFYAKQSRGFRSGAQQLRSLTLTDTIPADPEIVNEQEVGLKTEFWDKRVRWNIAGYHSTVKGAQRSVILSVGGTSQTILENADTENWGFETDLSLNVAEGLDLFASYAYTDPKYRSYNGFVAAGGVKTPIDKADYSFSSIVKDQFSLGANYQGDAGFARVNANVSYAWQGAMTQVVESVRVLTLPAASGGAGLSATEAAKLLTAGRTPSYGITNARLGFSFGPEDNYEVAVWGRNVFDKRAKQYILFLGGLNYVSASWNDPATYGVTVSAKF